MRVSREELAPVVATYGWAVIRIEAEEDEPSFAYSVGFRESFEHPEVIMFGLPTGVMHDIINGIGETVRNGRRYSPGDVASGLIEGFEVAFREVAPRARDAYMGIAWSYYGREFSALHCLWPDREGHFPWEHGASADFRRLQPMLSEGPEPATFLRPS